MREFNFNRWIKEIEKIRDSGKIRCELTNAVLLLYSIDGGLTSSLMFEEPFLGDEYGLRSGYRR
jgi:hypothetical protein